MYDIRTELFILMHDNHHTSAQHLNQAILMRIQHRRQLTTGMFRGCLKSRLGSKKAHSV